MNELHQLLTDCREKLQRYRDQHSGEYIGGVEFTALRGRIDAAIAKPLHCATGSAEKSTAGHKMLTAQQWERIVDLINDDRGWTEEQLTKNLDNDASPLWNPL